MFKNRKLEVKLIKDHKDESATTDSSDTTFEVKATTIADIAERVVKRIAMSALAYVIVDTARQVAIKHAERR